MELLKINSDLQELSLEEASDINGGESVWYWVAYGVGTVARGMSAFVHGAEEGSKIFYK